MDRFQVRFEKVYRDEKVIIGCNSVLEELPETAVDLMRISEWFENGNLQVPKETELEPVGVEGAVQLMRNGQGRNKFEIVL